MAKAFRFVCRLCHFEDYLASYALGHFCPKCTTVGPSETEATEIPEEFKQKSKMRFENEAAQGEVEPPTAEELTILQDPALFERIDAEFDKRIEGEKESRRAIFLFACIKFVRNSGTSNNLLVNSESSAGKDYTTREICRIFPKEATESLARASPNAFTFWHSNDPEFNWNGKICRICDISKPLLDSDAFKTFLSDEEKSVIVNKDKGGKIGAVEYFSQGKPIGIFTTAENNPKDELLNRVNIISLDESVAQTKAITRRQAREASGAFAGQNYDPLIVSALGKLPRVEVVVPYAESFIEFLPTEIRARRDVPRIFNLIKASAALFQFQREKDNLGRVIATGEDYERARTALKKIQTGSFVALTRTLRRVYAVAEEWQKANPWRWFTVKQLWATKPLCAERHFYEHLEKLAEKRLLVADFQEREESRKQVLVYQLAAVNGLTSIELPPFEKVIGFSSKPSELSNAPNQDPLISRQNSQNRQEAAEKEEVLTDLTVLTRQYDTSIPAKPDRGPAGALAVRDLIARLGGRDRAVGLSEIQAEASASLGLGATQIAKLIEDLRAAGFLLEPKAGFLKIQAGG